MAELYVLLKFKEKMCSKMIWLNFFSDMLASMAALFRVTGKTFTVSIAIYGRAICELVRLKYGRAIAVH
jgi:hypothetical protein